jgi:glycine hydroxymethyltransferase
MKLTLQEFIDLVIKHTNHRNSSINLISSENYSSPMVRAIFASDLMNRYSSDFYGGTKFINKIIQKTEGYIRELFDSDYAIVSPLSGNLCDLSIILGLTKPGKKIMVVEEGDGGYPLDYEFFGRKKVIFQFSNEDMNLLIEENIEAIKKVKPSLVIFGASFIPFPQPVKEITKEFEKRKTIHFAYDGSHVMGLIAGKEFQDPLREGVHVLIGSTHKSFPGPQGGIILTNDMERYEVLSSTMDFDIDKGIRFIDNNHPHHIAALGIAALEMLEFGTQYAKQVVKNSKALAKSLDENNVPVKFKHLDYTESHQVILDSDFYEQNLVIKERAEEIGLIIDAGIRIGTSEVTRMGMKELEMKELGEIISRVYYDDISDNLTRQIRDLANIFSKPSFCFSRIDEIPF